MKIPSGSSKIFFALVILCSLAAKIFYFDFVWINQHNDRQLFMGLRMIKEGVLNLSPGITGVMGPLYLYTLSLVLLISENPYALLLFAALLNLAAQILIFKFGREFFNDRIGWTAFLFFSTSFSTTLLLGGVFYQSYLLPPFNLLFFYSLFYYLFKKKPAGLVLLFFSYFILAQLYSMSLTLLPLLGVLLFVRRPRTSWIHYAAVALIFVIMSIPQGIQFLQDAEATYRLKNFMTSVFFFYEKQTAMENLFDRIFVAESYGSAASRIIVFFGRVLNPVDFHLLSPCGGFWPTLFSTMSRCYIGLFYVALVYTLFSSGRILIRSRLRQETLYRPDSPLMPALIALWWIVPMAILSAFKIVSDLRYFLPIFPCQHIVMAIFTCSVYKRIKVRNARQTRLLRLLFAGLISTICLSQVAQTCWFHRMNKGRFYVTGGERSPLIPISSKTKIVKALIQDFGIEDLHTYKETVRYIDVGSHHEDIGGFHYLFYYYAGKDWSEAWAEQGREPEGRRVIVIAQSDPRLRDYEGRIGKTSSVGPVLIAEIRNTEPPGMPSSDPAPRER